MRKIKKNDEVIVITGKHKGLSGSVLEINWKTNKILIDKINIVKKHSKPTQTNPDGGIREMEAPINISNVALKPNKKTNASTKVGFRIEADGKKIRYAKKTNKPI